MVDVDYVHVRDSPTGVYALRSALIGKKDNYIVVGEATSSEFMLTDNTFSSTLDVAGARNDGYGVSRLQNAEASEYSVVMWTPETLLFSITFESSGVSKEIGFDLLKALRDAINDAGLDGAIDQSSSQGNDVVINGQKVGAYGVKERNGYYVIGLFVSLDVDYSMANYITLPDKKFDGKVSDSIEERAAGLHEFKPELEASDVITYFGDRIIDNTPITSFTERSIPQQIQDEADTIEAKMRSNDELFKK